MENKEIDFLDKSLSYYEVLGVDEKSTSSDIKRAYRKLAVKYHPDKQIGCSEKEALYAESVMSRLNKIFTTLMDDDKRKEYDEKGEVEGTASRYATKEDSPIFDELFTDVEIPTEQAYTSLVMATLKPTEAIKGCRKTITVYDEDNDEEAEVTVDIPRGVITGTILTYYSAVKFESRVIPSNVSIAIEVKSSKKIQIDGNNIIIKVDRNSLGKTKSIMIAGEVIKLPDEWIKEANKTIYKGLGIKNEIENTVGDLILQE
ncbi:J domain-containing protein [Clostridium tertium]|uniref:J domain-containing protein n=1 Tax=Clostridium tertium TaxID=1559 RepID=UPI0023B2EA63|nr:J domain-containing protein [Clostridium tertium]